MGLDLGSGLDDLGGFYCGLGFGWVFWVCMLCEGFDLCLFFGLGRFDVLFVLGWVVLLVYVLFWC